MRVSRRLLLSLALLALAAPPALAARAGKISGKVKAPDGAGVLGAVVTIFKESAQGGTISFTRSDREGNYAIASLAPGAYFIQVSREGYAPVTHAGVKIGPGKTTTLDVILQGLLDFVVDDSDPRNWDFKKVLRSTSDRRLIFRYGDLASAGGVTGEGGAPQYSRSASINVTSSGLSSENYLVYPSDGSNGITSNFGFAEPVGEHGRMIFAGQLSSGYDSLWRVRNIYQYRPEAGREMKLSVGYGRLSLNSPGVGTVGRPAQFFSQDPSVRDSGVQTLGLSVESRSKIIDPVTLEYGVDYSRLSYASTKSVFSPFFQLVITPADTWTLKTSMISRRASDYNSLALPDGDVINLMDPTYITQIDGDVRLSEFKHREISVGKRLPDETLVEVAVYEDRMEGPGSPFMIHERNARGSATRVAQLREDQSAHRGARLSVNRTFLEFLNGSIAYVYGSGIAAPTAQVAGEILARDLVSYLHRSYYHGVSGQLDARFPKTGTQLSTVVRWYPGLTLSPLDLFYDRRDTLTKGLNVFVRQAIPLPEFMGTPGRWEALVDVRNLFDQGKGFLRTSDGDLTLTRNPRSFRFGLNLNIY